MLTRTPVVAALVAISLAYAGNAAAQTDVLVVEGTSSVGVLNPRHRDEIHLESLSWSTSLTPATAAGLAARRDQTSTPLPNSLSPSAASTGRLKLETIDAKPAIAINTPLRTVISRSPAADGSSATLMAGEKFQRQAPALATPIGRR